MRTLVVTTLSTLLILVILPAKSDARHWQQRSDLRLTIAAPESSYFRIRRRHGIRTLHYVNRRSLVASTQWPLIFRIESRTAVGFVAKRNDAGQEREGLVITNPDDCFHLGSLFEDMTPPVFDPTCSLEDETYFELQTEKFDTFGEFDNATTGNDALRARLVDEKFSAPEPRNTPYLRMFDGKVKPVGPKTGGGPVSDGENPPELDGFGYGTDDDLASFVLMVDAGGARVFDENFDLLPGVLRNMAGFFNTVSFEDQDGRGQSAVTASIHALAGVFEPIAIVDAAVSDPSLAGSAYAIRVDSGPVEGFNLTEPYPPSGPGAANAFYREILSKYYPRQIEVRAVVVNGEAPAFIYDMDGDKRYTARDVEMMGYSLLSNEVRTRLTVTLENLIEDSPDNQCPPRTFIHGDVDGNAERGLLPECKNPAAGASRLRRIRR